MDRHQVWYVCAPNDDYFAGVICALTEDEARAVAWEEFVKGREEDWAERHASSAELVVRPLGQSYFGTDGSGRIEVDL